MGSLPNLNELSRDKLESPVNKSTPPTAAVAGNINATRLPSQAPISSHSHKKLRSGGHHQHHHHNTAQVWDNDAMLEHMATYSPISCRSARASALSWRRRDSMSSSAGASSVRRLIAAVRTAPAGPRPPKKAVVRHCAAVLLGHASWSAATLPLLPLQAGLGAFEPRPLGPALLSMLFFVASLASCLAPLITHKLGTNLALCLGQLITVAFIAAHLSPRWYLLLPSYTLMGAWLSASFLSRVSHVNVSATNLGLVCSDPEDPDETRRECILRRLSRGVKLAEDFGLAFGCLLAWILIKITDGIPNPNDPVFTIEQSNARTEETCGAEYCSLDQISLQLYSHNYYNDPSASFFVYSGINKSSLLAEPPAGQLSARASRMILSVWLGLAALAFGISCAFLDARLKEPQANQEKLSVKRLLVAVKAAFQDPKMQLAAPLALFIGLEQGFIYTDFTKAYVGCALGGAGPVTLSFLSFGLLQAIGSATLSMLMRHVRRYFVIAVGFAFQACLLLALIAWKPAGDDPALFHVISAAWGVCNAIWETLIFTLLLGLHGNNWPAPLAASLFWRWLGVGLAMGLHGLVCTRVRVLALGATLVASAVPYAWLEVRLASRGKCLGPL